MYAIKLPLSFLLASLFLVTQVNAQENPRTIQIEDLLNIKRVGSPVASPDGQWIAYTVSETDLNKDKSETRIWMIPSKGGDAIPMTGKGYSASQPQWSPDNKYLSFISSKGGTSQVWTLNRLGGEAIQLTDIIQGVNSHLWSPDGSRLLLSITDAKPEELTKTKEDDDKPKPYVIDRLQFKRDYAGYLDRYRTHLYVYTPGDSAAVQITSGDFDDSSPVWSPDGKQIAFVSNRTDEPDGNTNSDIWIVSADNTNKGKNLIQVTTNQGPDRSPAWSPDGKHIAHISTVDLGAIWYATNHLAIVPSGGGNATLLTENIDRNMSSPTFYENGNSIYFLLEESGTTILASISPNGRNFERAVPGEHSISSFEIINSGFALLMEKVNQPREIFTFQQNNLTKLTSVNDEHLSQLKKPDMEKITFNSADGTEIEGFVVKPLDFDPSKTYPTILWAHGGPVSQYEYSFHSPSQLFAANGYVTLLINPRGSSGYGQAFSEILFADWGNKDFEDVMAGVDYSIEQGWSDPERLGVGGWSYGGILTNYVITKSDRFKGAISGASEALYRSNYGHDHYQLTWELELGLPWENAEAWERISPFNDVAEITTPTLWIGGADDWNVPIINSEQMYQAMKRLGRTTQLVVYPGEHHGIRRPSFQKDRYERYLDWFDTYVK
ncbi:MAG: S9 family peptidase [Balneolaceae bacterium]|nr:S9 family peptidase [Balneolaceae bacterium]MBO6546560.1 S9 family peptidase [Balneolaceae bacterium]MBO6648919.1 S9 family peptidase [Balneolaceae bacterium]